MVGSGLLRPARVLVLAIVGVLTAGLLTVLPWQAAAAPPDPGPRPEQEQGSAAGRSHRASSASTEEKDRPDRFDRGGPPAKGTPEDKPHAQPDLRPPAAAETAVEVDRSEPPGKVQGFDASTSRESPDRGGSKRQVFENADGTVTTRYFEGRQMFQRSDGGWQKIDPTLVARQGGGWESKADSEPKRFAETANAGELASVDLETGHGYGFGVANVAGVRGAASGDSVRYRDVRSDADLELQATPVGIKETIVLRSADAPTTWQFPLALDGLTAKLDGQGAVQLTNAAGAVEAVIPPGFMEDSKIDPRSGDGARSHAVEYRLAGEPGSQVLHVSVDADWIADPAREFPVRVDPTVQKDSNGSTYVQYPYTNDYSGESVLKVGTPDGGSTKANAFLKFATVTSALDNMKILDAKVGLYNVWSYSCSAREVRVHRVAESWSVSGNKSWPGPSVGWELGSKSFASGWTNQCGPKWHRIDLGAVGDPGINVVQGWVRGEPNYGLRVSASTTDSYSWKKFASANSANAPYLEVTYSPYWAEYTVPSSFLTDPTTTTDGAMRVTVKNDGKYTWTPSSGYKLSYRLWDTASGKELLYPAVARTDMTTSVGTGQSITLDATVKRLDPGSYRLRWDMVREGDGGLRFSTAGVPYSNAVYFTIPNQRPYVTSMSPKSGFKSSTLRPTLKATGKDPDNYPGTLLYRFRVCDENLANCTYSDWSSSSSWKVPVGTLKWSTTYLWQVRLSDSVNWSYAWTQGAALTPVVPQPAITSRLGGKAGGGVDPGVGNFTTSATDASVAATGPALSVERTYNSHEPRQNLLFGSGWATRWDTGLVPDNDGSGNVVITYPDGRQARFGKNDDGSYGAPQGQQATLVAITGGGWTLRQPGDVLYEFDVDGRLVTITDTVGRSQTLTYTNGQLTQATDAASGRSLTFIWSGGHVTSVTTGLVPALTWTYTYTGDTLTQVCDPEGGCTGHSYRSGTLYRTTTVDAGPKAYWRLGDAATATAKSEVPGIHGEVDGTTSSLTADPSGPIAGSPLGSAAFAGTSGNYVKFGDDPLRGERFKSVELWFKTTTTSGGVLFSETNRTPGDGLTTSEAMPVLYVGTDGKLYGHFCNGNVTGIVTTGIVNDGGWHHVVLTAADTSQTLYLDGTKVGTQTGTPCGDYPFAYLGISPVSTQSWPARPTGPWGAFTGSIAEAAVYTRPLGAATVAEHYAARQQADHLLTVITKPGGALAASLTYDMAAERVAEHTDANGAAWKYGVPATGSVTDEDDVTTWRTTVAVTDPITEDTTYSYDPANGGRLVEIRNPEDRGGARTTYDYDEGGFLYRITRPNGHATELRHDQRGNLISKTVPYWDGISHTEYWSYYLNTADPLDPRNDQVTDHRNARSSSATDDTYRTRYTFNTDGQVTTIEAPGATGGPQQIATNTYTTGSEAAVGGGTMPPGLLLTVTDPGGGVTSYAYTSAGDLARTTDPVGGKHENGYDGIGRLTSESVELSDGTLATTTRGYDQASRLTEIRQPVVTNAVTGVEQQLLAVHTYNPDGTLATTTESDTKLAGSERTTTYGYDSLGRRNKTTDPEGGIEQLEYNNLGKVWKRTDRAGASFTNTYAPTHTGWQLATTTVHGWTGDGGEPQDVVLESRAYDPAGRLARVTDAMGNTIAQTYWHNNRPASTWLVGYTDPDTGTDTALRLMHRGYTGTGKVYGEVRTEGTENRTDYTWDPGDRVSKAADKENGVVLRTVDTVYDDLDNPVDVKQLNADGTPASHTEFAYDAAGRETQRTQHVTTTKTAVAKTIRDSRGLPTAVIDPRGNVTGANPDDYTTSNTYDALGRLTTIKAPPVAVEAGGGTPATKRPTTTTGYNAFGEITHQRDPNGNVTRTAHDRAGRTVSLTLPDYTPPGAATPITASIQREYNNAGWLNAEVDADGNRTTYGYDELGNLRMQVDPSLSIGNPGATTLVSYTPTGLPRVTTDPTGAQTDTTYDELGRALTSTVIERKPTLRNLTTQYRYDALGNRTKEISPSGLTTTTDYDGLGNPTKITDPAGIATTAKYDSNGNVKRITHPDTAIRYFGYDYAGQNTSMWDETTGGALLREWHYGYDLTGNRTGEANTAGHYTEHTYDAANRLTKIRRLKSGTTDWITTSYGYDPAGNITRATDGNGHKTVFTVNPWNLPESTIEPATEQHPAAADRTYTATYTKTGAVAELRKPGDVTITNTYNPVGNLIKQAGAGAEVPTSDRTFDYDLADRMTAASAPGGTNTYTYDDRANLLTATGPSGDTQLAWNDDGQLASTTTGAGAAQFTYTTGRLGTAADPITGTTTAYSYDTAGRVKTAGPTGGATRTYGYDTFGRLATDTITKPDNTTSAKITYGYNEADELTSKTTTGIAGAAANTYTYDKAGRLTSWNNGTTDTNYTWDDNGNLTQKGATSQTFNPRNQLLSSGSTSYADTPRGTRSSSTTGSTTTDYTFNAYDELTTVGTATYTYDALNRLTTSSGGNSVEYLGTTRDVAAASGWSYTYSPTGEQLAAGNTTTSGLAWNDQHTDLIGIYNPATGTLGGSRSYDPFGDIAATTGADPSVGYQHQYTDPATGTVNMGSRWYNPETVGFSSRDGFALDPRDTLNGNRYAYVGGSPLNYTDPSGNCPWCVIGLHILAHTAYEWWTDSGTAHAPTLSIPSYYLDWGSQRPDKPCVEIMKPGCWRGGSDSNSGSRPGGTPSGYWGPSGIGAQPAGASGGGTCDSTCQAARRQHYWDQRVKDRANTRAPRPKPTEDIWDATKRLWDEANDPRNDTHVGLVDGDKVQTPYKPETVDDEASQPGTLTKKDLELLYKDYEVFYRAMSLEELDSFGKLGIQPLNGESFVTQEYGYIKNQIPKSKRADDYDVVIAIYAKKGTRQLLIDHGARDDPPSGELRKRGLAHLPVLEAGNKGQVHIKTEDRYLTYGLRGGWSGTSADLFNQQIEGATIVEWLP